MATILASQWTSHGRKVSCRLLRDHGMQPLRTHGDSSMSSPFNRHRRRRGRVTRDVLRGLEVRYRSSHAELFELRSIAGKTHQKKPGRISDSGVAARGRTWLFEGSSSGKGYRLGKATSMYPFSFLRPTLNMSAHTGRSSRPVGQSWRLQEFGQDGMTATAELLLLCKSSSDELLTVHRLP